MAQTSGQSGISLDTILGSTLPGAINAGATVYGSQNAAEAQNKGIQAGIGQQNTTMGNINSLFGAQKSAGDNAFTQLQTLQGGNGQTADYSNFNNSPGYNFAVQQGTQAINRQAAANGSLYTPGTAAAVGQYVTGTASQNYNNYVQQLLATAGYGASGNNALSTANLTTGSNISQLDQNSGNAEAGGIAGAAGGVGSGISGLLSSLFGSGTNASGVGGAAGGIGSALSGIGNIARGLNSDGSWSPGNSIYGSADNSSLFGDLNSSTGSQLNSDYGNIISGNSSYNYGGGVPGGDSNPTYGGGDTTYFGDGSGFP